MDSDLTSSIAPTPSGRRVHRMGVICPSNAPPKSQLYLQCQAHHTHCGFLLRAPGRLLRAEGGGQLLSHGDDGEIGVGADDDGHNRSVDDVETVEAVDLAVLVD